jgi:starch phosphorylase
MSKEIDSIKSDIISKLERLFGCGITDATVDQLYQALAFSVRDEVMARRALSRGMRAAQAAKKVYYLSAEFLVGRAMYSNMITLINERAYLEALDELGIDKSLVFEQEPEPGLGNGGLGRLAACFLDSLSALKLPAMGMTIRYEYGLFRQHMADGYQVELPDNWLVDGNIWEIYKPKESVEVHFGGQVENRMENAREVYYTRDYYTVLAVPYDMPVLGYDSNMVNMLRTWSARSMTTLDMQKFSQGDYAQATVEKELAEVISKVLYPEDNHQGGKELRLKQQYFLASASVGYIVRDFEKHYGARWYLFPEKVAIHINDTHPGMAIPELVRVLIDEKGLTWDRAMDVVRRTFAYTNHTVMQEALEKWPEETGRRLMPRVYMLLEEMNRRLCAELWAQYPGQWELVGAMAIISYGHINMANLCVALTKRVNGVSQIHTEILKRRTFKEYARIEPDRFISITNGISHRRWLMQANPGLANLCDSAMGQEWRAAPGELKKLAPMADDAAFRDAFARIKAADKRILAGHLLKAQGAPIDPESIFLTQAKRLHEYKRQLMNALSILMLYNRIDGDPNFDMHPVTYIFGAKASPGYFRAKLIIKLICSVADLVKKHPRASKLINVVFAENYCVSLAELLIPATDISAQISTAGKEASGTGNMKFMMNGGITIGTMDGANVEICQAVGPENIYIFGLSAEDVERAYETGSYRAAEVYETNAEVRRVIDQLINGTLSPESPRLFQDLYQSLLFGDGGGMADPYFVLKDLPGFALARKAALTDYSDRARWLKKAIINTASSGVFSSDRVIAEYNEKIWRLQPLKL